MIVVADTGPLNYLVQIQAEHVLPALFHSVVVPRAVITELMASGTPEPVRSFIAAPPPWLVIGDATAEGVARIPGRLGAGEVEAIALAVERGASLLVDDSAAWKAARDLGINTIRTLAILQIAAERGHIDLLTALDRLAATTFYVTPTSCCKCGKPRSSDVRGSRPSSPGASLLGHDRSVAAQRSTLQPKDSRHRVLRRVRSDPILATSPRPADQCRGDFRAVHQQQRRPSWPTNSHQLTTLSSQAARPGTASASSSRTPPPPSTP